MNVNLRPGTPEDAETCGRICYEAFGAIARKHVFDHLNDVDVPAFTTALQRFAADAE